MGMCSLLYIDENDRFLSVLPLHHTYECTCGYLCQLYRGSCVAVSSGLRYIVQNMKETKTTIILVVPLMIEAFYRGIMRKITDNPKQHRKFKFGLALSRFLLKIGIDIRPKLFKQIHEGFGGHLRLIISGGAAIEPSLIKNMQDMGFHLSLIHILAYIELIRLPDIPSAKCLRRSEDRHVRWLSAKH